MQDPQFTQDPIDWTTNVFNTGDDSSFSAESFLEDIGTLFDLGKELHGSRWSDSDSGVDQYEGTRVLGSGTVTQARGQDNIDDQNAVRVETTSYGDEARIPTPAHFMGDRLARSDNFTSSGANTFPVPLNLSRDHEPSVSNRLSVDNRPSLDRRPPVTGWSLLDQRPLMSNRPSFDQLLSVDNGASQDDGLSVEDRLDVGYRHLTSREPSEDYMRPVENRSSVDDGLSLDYRLFGHPGPSVNYRPLLDNRPSMDLFGDLGSSANDGPSMELFGHQRPSVDDGPSVDIGLWGNHGPSVDYGHVVTSRTFVTDQEMQNELDKMFETLDEGDKTTEAEPDKAIASKLYPHQKQALNWMICQENKETLPPFWVKRGSVYTNTLTKQRREAMPRSVCGGILADDMGLGKTLEMISLIMTNSVDGKPLVQPLPGRCRTPLRFTGKSPSKSVSTRVDSGIMDSQRTSESVHQLFTDSRSTGAANLPLSAKLILPQNQIVSAESVAERSSEKCFADNVVIKKEVPEDSSFSFENSEWQPASTSGRSSVKRPAAYSCDGDKDDEWSLPSPAKRLAEYSYDGDVEDVEVFQPAAKNGRGVTPGLLEKAVDMCLKEDRAVIFNQEQATTSHTEVMSAVNSIDGIQPHYTSGNGTASLNHDSSPFLPVTDDETNSCGNMRLQTGQDTTSDNYLNEIIDVDALSDSEFPIVIEDSDEDELPDISSPPSNSSSKENIDASAEHPREHQITRDRPWADQSRGTVIICPVSVISNWVDQFEEHVDKSVPLKLHVYYGSSRSKDTDFLKQQDVIITTYLTLASDAKKLETSPLHQIEWLRIVLDEGHNIRNPAAKQSKAIYELRAERRWVLTGTPIQNSMKDLWSLMNFLQVEPFTEKSWWNRTIARPIAKREKPALKRVAHLMGSLAMRRTKNQQLNGKPLVELPARHVYLEKITLSEEERAVYEAMQKEGKVIIGRYFRQGTLLHHYGQVLTILLRLRQLCCHPRLIASAVEKTANGNPAGAFEDLMPQGLQSTDNHTEMSEEDRKKLIDQLMAVLNSGSDEDCSICLDSLKNAVITPCAHIFCRACIEAVIEKEEPQPLCPLCRRVVDKNSLTEVPPETRQEEADQDDEVEDWQSSAKVDALMKALNELRQQDPRVKSVIVSQFTSLLTVLETPLGMQGFKFTRLDGTMNVSARQQALEEFADLQPGSPTIFLLSLKAGGVGINLTAASRVFLMDPAWNPAAEDQCFDRCHRLGQTKDVVITRFVIEASVEERMLEIQDKKKRLMKGAFTKKITADERRNNRIDDIRRLISL